MKFKDKVAKKEFITKTTIYNDNSKADTIYYYNGYDKTNKIISKANSEFYVYDSLNRIIKKYECILDRDPECNSPYIYTYQYSGNKLLSIKCINHFDNDTNLYIGETFKYDNFGRLIEQTKFEDDTIRYSYIGNDTLVQTEIWINWVEPFGNKVKVERKTTYKYDNLKRKISLTWVEPIDNLSTRSDFTYDNKNRLILQKDTSLENSTVHQENSCYVLNWKELKYDNENRLIEEIYSIASYDDLKKILQRKIIYKY